MSEREWNKQINPMTGYREGNLRGIQGAGNEQLVAARALKHGFIVFFKLWSDTKYDMVIDAEGELFRAQVKGTASGSVPFTTVQRGGVQRPEERPVHHYTRDDCDLIIGVDSETGDCYVIPIDYAIATGRNQMNFRDLENFRERWDFVSGNDYLSAEQNRTGIGHSEMRNKLREMEVEDIPTDRNGIIVAFYENCPVPEEDATS